MAVWAWSEVSCRILAIPKSPIFIVSFFVRKMFCVLRSERKEHGLWRRVHTNHGRYYWDQYYLHAPNHSMEVLLRSILHPCTKSFHDQWFPTTFTPGSLRERVEKSGWTSLMASPIQYVDMYGNYVIFRSEVGSHQRARCQLHVQTMAAWLHAFVYLKRAGRQSLWLAACMWGSSHWFRRCSGEKLAADRNLSV
jgi:hypothetical protein